jgi:hypothetical protein
VLTGYSQVTVPGSFPGVKSHRVVHATEIIWKINQKYLAHTVHFTFRQYINYYKGTRGSVIGWGTMIQAGGSRVRFPRRSLDFFNWPNYFSRIKALGSTEPVTEMSTRNLPGGKGRPARKADTPKANPVASLDSPYAVRVVHTKSIQNKWVCLYEILVSHIQF